MNRKHRTYAQINLSAIRENGIRIQEAFSGKKIVWANPRKQNDAGSTKSLTFTVGDWDYACKGVLYAIFNNA